ncbi:MAG: hypothetical protein VW230_04165 [Candidatus Poseidoniales archaeon]
MSRIVSVLMAFLLLLTIGSNGISNETEIFQEHSPLYTTSTLDFSFNNAPEQDEEITGSMTLSFTISGTGTVDSILIEISDDNSTFTTVKNLTSSPWVTFFDSTLYTNDTYVLRATLWDSDVNDAVVTFSGTFSIVNQVPVITQFSALNPAYGTGESSTDRAWFNIQANGSIGFSWQASDDDLKQATLTAVPGPGSPSTDGPTTINYGWTWASGAMSEGIWSPRLTVYDNSGLTATKTVYIGIDRTAPTIGSLTVGTGATWQNSQSITISGLQTAVSDGTGSGLAYVEYKQPTDTIWTQTTSNAVTLTFDEGTTNLSMRAVDRVGNIGTEEMIAIKVDTSAPEFDEWQIDELTTDRQGLANVTAVAFDAYSGIDASSSYIQYGFDRNGVGDTPDLSGRWITVGTTGLDAQVGLSNWASKSRQYLMVRAVIVDNASNSFTTEASAFQILPSIDFSWSLSETNVDRLIVRPGERTGNITITSVLEHNKQYGGTVMVRLESAPADRSASVSWTILETRSVAVSGQGAGNVTLIWNYTVPNTGQFDLRLTIDHVNVIDEYNEANNYHYLVVTGASVDSPGTVPSFAPSILVLILAGLFISRWQRKTTD